MSQGKVTEDDTRPGAVNEEKKPEGTRSARKGKGGDTILTFFNADMVDLYLLAGHNYYFGRPPLCSSSFLGRGGSPCDATR